MNEGEITVHTMPIEALRARADEAQRLIAQAREIVRDSFDALHRAPSDGPEASGRVGLLLDAAQRLLPGMPPLADERLRSYRAKERESGWRRVTLRAGPEKAIAAIERAEILATVADQAAGLIAEIDRRSSSMLRVADVSAVGEDARRRS
jgi:hypothetical protein